MSDLFLPPIGPQLPAEMIRDTDKFLACLFGRGVTASGPEWRLRLASMTVFPIERGS